MPVKFLIRRLCLAFIISMNFAQAKDVLIWTSNEGAAKAINEIKVDFEKEYNTKVVHLSQTRGIQTSHGGDL